MFNSLETLYERNTEKKSRPVDRASISGLTQRKCVHTLVSESGLPGSAGITTSTALVSTVITPIGIPPSLHRQLILRKNETWSKITNGLTNKQQKQITRHLSYLALPHTTVFAQPSKVSTKEPLSKKPLSQTSSFSTEQSSQQSQ